jgi:poly-gamma-glutamate synthesis protein (capsule biosynthesis protein)
MKSTDHSDLGGRHQGGNTGRNLAIAIIIGGLFVASAILTAWLTAGAPWRDRNQVIMLIDAELAPAKMDIRDQSAHLGIDLHIEQVDKQTAITAIASGAADLALLSEQPPGLDGFVVANRYPVLAVPFLHPLQDITSQTAREILAAIDAQIMVQGENFEVRLPGPGQEQPKAPADLEANHILVGERINLGPGWRALSIDGVSPYGHDLEAGRYPLQQPLWLVERPTHRGIMAPILERRRFPNRDAVASLTAWLQGDGKALMQGDEPCLSLTAVGDIMLGRAVERRITEFGADYPFMRVTPYLQRSDVTFANLESPLGTGGTPIPGKGIWFRADPALAATMAEAGIDAVTLANNHILDYDSELLLETLDALHESGITYCGAGRNTDEAHRPLIINHNGVRLAFLGYSQFGDLFWSWEYNRSFAAGPDLPGVACLGREHLAQIKTDINKARAEADVVIVACHWGDEYVEMPNEEQRYLAHALADAGADLILGSHPHAIQGFEYYQGTVIVYSLGNFIMDQARPVTCRSMILEAQITPQGINSLSVTPAIINECQPYVPEGAEYYELADRIRRISRPLVTQ